MRISAGAGSIHFLLALWRPRLAQTLVNVATLLKEDWIVALGARIEFNRDAFASDPRIAAMRWERG